MMTASLTKEMLSTIPEVWEQLNLAGGKTMEMKRCYCCNSFLWFTR
jgi:hypothetical protein